MSGNPIPVTTISNLDFHLGTGVWDYARDHAEAIDAYWADQTASQPSLFNGTVLILQEGAPRDGIWHGTYLPVPYKAFLHYLRHEARGYPARNAFALAALTGADDTLVMGVMGQETANAGRVYFPGGTPDLSDVRDGRVDLLASVRRELTEETGLTPEELSEEPGFTLVEAPLRLGFLKVYRSPLSGGALAETIRARLARQSHPELADVVVLDRDSVTTETRMPPFQAAYARWWFAGRGRSP